MVKAFAHEPLTDFTKSENKQAFKEELQRVNSQLGIEYPLIINGERIITEEKMGSFNPANIKELVGKVSKATKEHAEHAMQAALEAFNLWKKWNPDARVQLLWRTASILRRRKHEFSAYLVKEVGKTWGEADADAAAAIDYIEYYAEHMMSLIVGTRIQESEGEVNQYQYIPLGVGVIMLPFNSPLANLAKTAIAAIVAGNTVLLKPSNHAPIVAAKFIELMEEAGLPKGVLNYIPGSNNEIGDFLLDHPKTRFVSFTGSRVVGCRIYERTAKVHPGQGWLKHVIAEISGKNTVVVDEDADLDLAAASIVYSGFGYSGQKYSAGTRAVVHEKIYDQVLEKVVALTKTLKVGDPEQAETYMGPVIDRDAFFKIMTYIKIGKKEGKLVAGGEGDLSHGYYIQPTIFADVDENAHLMQDEICGPIIAFCKAYDMDHLLEIANNTEYGLTGAFFSHNRSHIERAREEIQVGNLYINCTGTRNIVGHQSLGDLRMSRTDSKAGSLDGLLLYMQTKTIFEGL
jgi:1-pyrroline-5-carboxylate dehydrogenase